MRLDGVVKVGHEREPLPANDAGHPGRPALRRIGALGETRRRLSGSRFIALVTLRIQADPILKQQLEADGGLPRPGSAVKIGRASCRERVF